MNKELQTSLEFVIMVGFVLLFFSVFLFIIQSNMSDKIQQRTGLELKVIASDAQSEINLALEASDGYSREFEIPEKVGNMDYDINVVEEMVYVNTTDSRNALALPVPNVTGNLQKGKNTIRKEEGEIILNQ